MATYIIPFAEWLGDRGYGLVSMRNQVLMAAGFSSWLRQEGIALSDINGEHPERYLLDRAQRPKLGDDAALRHLPMTRHTSRRNWPLPGLSDRRERSLRIGRTGWATSANSPVIGLPPIRELRFLQRVCFPFAQREHDRISIQGETFNASCRPRWRCRADIPAAGSGHGHIIACSDC